MEDLERLGRLTAAYKELPTGGMAQQTLQLGYPVFTDADDVQTACVGFSADRRLQFFWNRTFFDALSIQEIAYVAAHEAMHVLLRHMVRREGRNPHLWNIACDVMVNIMVDRTTRLFINSTSLLYNRIRAKSVGLRAIDVADMTTEEIYDKLPKSISNDVVMVDGHDKWDSFTEEVCESITHSIKPPKDRRSWGHGSEKELERLRRLICKPFDWERLLRNRLASARKPREGENWTRPNRKIYRYYPDVLLPGPAETEQSTALILVAIDTSGSMSNDDISKMVALVESLPQDAYEVHLTWFDTGVYYAKDLAQAVGRGGTNFNCIEAVAAGKQLIGDSTQPAFKVYPDVVVCMTDGYADTPILSKPDRWVWIITENGSTRAIKNLKSTVWKL